MARRRLVVLLLLALGCRETASLFTLQQSFKNEYPGSRIGVSLTDGINLTITVYDSAQAHAPCDRQAAEAVRLATYARDHYATFDSLQMVSVAFASRPARRREPDPGARLPYRFAPTAVRAGLGATDSVRAVEFCRNWDQLNAPQ